MQNQINFEINNFGPIVSAEFRLKKLNVIAGVNGSGKSISAKLLYCFLTSNSDYADYLANRSIQDDVNLIINDFQNSEELAGIISSLAKLSDPDYITQIKLFIGSLKQFINDNDINNHAMLLDKLNRIENKIDSYNSNTQKYFNVSNLLLKSEFNINYWDFKDYSVKFYGNDGNSDYLHEIVSNNDKIGFKINEGNSSALKFNNAVYIDSMSVFDIHDEPYNFFSHHFRFLLDNLTSKRSSEDVLENGWNKKFKEIENKFNQLINGYVTFNPNSKKFIFTSDGKKFSMKDTASGIKQLAILQFLISNRILNENSFLIMDNPEVNLHPEWQVKLAEIIVLMVKNLKINIFINSHSPQFIEALEVYSAKYCLNDDSKFYLSENTGENHFIIEEIPRQYLTRLYNNLGDSYDLINKLRADNMFNGIF